MANIKLKKKNYLGEGYLHYFKNDITGEITVVPTTEQEYKKMGEKDGAKHNPTLAGHTWIQSAGGTIMVDNPDTILGIGEYVEVNGEIVARVDDVDEFNQFKKVDKLKVDKDGNLDDKDLKNYGDSI